MVVDKLFEFIEDIERFCVNHKWSRFFNDWETGDEALDEYAMIYKNCCNDVDEEKDAANDIFTELTEYMDCLYNYIDVDYVKLLDDEKQNARKWLDKVEKVIGSCVFSLKGNDLKGFLIKGYQMCHLIKEAAVKTPDEYYGGRRTDVMPYYLGENKNQLFNNILNEDNMGKLNEKRIELQNEHPVTRDEIIRFLDNSDRLQWRGKYDDKKLRIYIASDDDGKERYDLLAEVEPISIGYIIHGRDGYRYQGESYEDFKSDMTDAIRHFDFNVFDTIDGNGEDVLNNEFKEAAYALGRLKMQYFDDDIDFRWTYDDDDIPYIVESGHKSPLFTVKWVDTEEHPKSYAVSDGRTTEFFSDKESAYKKIRDIVKQSYSLDENKKKALFDKLLKE